MEAKLKLVKDRLSQFKRSPLSLEILGELIQREVRLLQPALTESLSHITYRSYLEGLERVASSVPLNILPKSTLPPKPTTSLESLLKALGSTLESPTVEANPVADLPGLTSVIRRLEAIPVTTGVDYLATAARVREGCFAITTKEGVETVNTIRNLVVEGLREGYGVTEFIEKVESHFEEGLPLSPARLEMTFRTNVQQAHADGLYEGVQQPLVSSYFPYVRRFATADKRTRPHHAQLEHLGLDGTGVYRVDDPTWKQFRAPFYYNCRCSDTYITVDQAAKLGVTEAQEWLEKATTLAKEKGGIFNSYLDQVRPAQPKWVDPEPFKEIEHFERPI